MSNKNVKANVRKLNRQTITELKTKLTELTKNKQDNSVYAGHIKSRLKG